MVVKLSDVKGGGKVRCPFCSEYVDLGCTNDGVVEHMVLLKTADGHMHVHGPLSDAELVADFVRAILIEIAKQGGK